MVWCSAQRRDESPSSTGCLWSVQPAGLHLGFLVKLGSLRYLPPGQCTQYVPWSTHRVCGCGGQAGGDCLSADFTSICEQQSLKGGDRQMTVEWYPTLPEQVVAPSWFLASLNSFDAPTHLSFATS